MARLGCDNQKWGAVDDPETGELIQLDESHPMDVCERVADAYAEIYITESEDSPEGDDTDTTPDVEPDDEEHHCGVNGCKRTVDSPSATCWQHED